MREHAGPGWWRAHPVVADSLLAGALLATVSTVTFVRRHAEVPEGYRRPDALLAVLLVAAIAPIAARRIAPTPALIVMVAALLATQGLAYAADGIGFGVLAGTYAVAAHARPRPSRRLAVAFGAVLSGWIVVGLLVDAPNANASEILTTNVVYATAWVLGDNVRRRREHVATLEERARHLEHERALEDRDARARERAAIARELHDVVAHSVTVMVVQASGARRAARRDPTAAIGALEVIEETGRASLAELRRILDVLRDGESPELVPQPSITRIGELASSDGALPVEIAMHGSARELRSTVDVSAYRIVQEALTNVRKHAGPRAKASVDIDFGAETLTVRVNDDGRGAMTLVEPRTRPGHGIVGMRERVAVCGGTLHTGPRDGGGWSVTASLPYEEPT